MTPNECVRAIDGLSDAHKFDLLTNHYKPPDNFDFPKQITEKEKKHDRSFQLHWLDDYIWMVYSKTQNAPFCLACVFFGVTGVTADEESDLYVASDPKRAAGHYGAALHRC